MQIHLETTTAIETSNEQYKIEKQSFKIAQIIRKEASNVNMVNITCKVTDIDDIKLVGKPPNQIKKRDVYCSDATGSIILVLWRDRAENISFAVNDVLSVENVGTTTYNNTINLSTNSQTNIKKIQDPSLQNLTTTPALQSHFPQDKITSVNTKILGIKDFKQQANCINCKNSIPIPSADQVLECPICSATFLIEDSHITNECSLLLKQEQPTQQWYTAKTGVSESNTYLHIFNN